jgi:flagellar transcriptional activator FlhC
MGMKSLVAEGRQIGLAIELINLGARLQLLEMETSLSRERLLKLYKELKGVSPPKGMLPFSTDWFITWQPNIHASLFINIYSYLLAHAQIKGIDAVVKTYRLYLEQMPPESGAQPVLSLARAWTLIRFFENNLLVTVSCTQCGGHFVAHALDLHEAYRCGLCHVPSRAGKKKKSEAEHVLQAIP